MNGRRADGPAPANFDPQRGQPCPPEPPKSAPHSLRRERFVSGSFWPPSSAPVPVRGGCWPSRPGAEQNPGGPNRRPPLSGRVRRGRFCRLGRRPGGECWREGGCSDVGTRRSVAERGGLHPCAGPSIGGPADERRCHGRRWCRACRSRRGRRRLPAVWPTGLREVPSGRWPSRSPLQWSLLAGELSGPLPGASGSIRLLRDPLAIVARAEREAGWPLRSRHDARRPSPFRSAEDGR